MTGTPSELITRIKERRATVAIVGLGYVGLPLAVAHANAGFRVVGVDLSDERVRAVNAGQSYIADIADRKVKEAVAAGRLRATRDFAEVREADVITVCVPTPLDRHKSPDMTYIEGAANGIRPHLRAGQLVILESTTYPGTTEGIFVPRIESVGLKAGVDVHLAFSPERIDPGNSRYKVEDIPKVVGGLTPACGEATRLLYEASLSKQAHIVSSPRAAEMTKLLENIYRIVNVSLVNEMAMLCDRMGLDIWEVIHAASTKPFGFMPFYPGPGMGGHCIPVDAFYLSWKAKEYGFATRFIELAGQVNDGMPDYVVERVAEQLNERARALNGSRVLLVGVAYKANVADVRESPAIEVAHRLVSRGAQIRYHDPHVPATSLAGAPMRSVPLTPDEVASADLVLVLTNHAGVDYAMIAERAAAVYDTRNVVPDAPNVRRLGAGMPLGTRSSHA